jgi:peptide/nickel transport system substrate-binding protein
MRKYYWYFNAYIRKHGLLLVLSIVIAILFFSFFIPVIARLIEAKPTTYIGMIGHFNLQTLPLPIQQKISSGLTIVEPDGTISPDLAIRWSVEDEGSTYRFIIDETAVWQDGKRLVPEDVNYSFPDVEIITTQNDVVFKLPDTFVPFPTTVAQPLFRVETQPYWFVLKRDRVIGLGDYEVTSFVEQGARLKELAIESNTERIVYRFYLTEQDAVDAFKLGQVDILQDMTATYDLASWDSVEIVETISTDRYLAVFFDLSNPTFTENIRQALSYGLPKVEGERRAIGPLNPDSWAYLEGGKGYEYEPDRGIERILSEVPQQPIAFELATTPAFEAKAENIKQQWMEFGQLAYQACLESDDVEDKTTCENVKIDVRVRITNFPDTSNFQALLIGQEIPADPDQYALWHSEQNTNFTRYKNTRIDSLLERGRQVADRQERLAIYQEFQQFFLEDAPAVFLEYVPSYDIVRR